MDQLKNFGHEYKKQPMEQRKLLIAEILVQRRKYEYLNIHDRRTPTGDIDFIEIQEHVSPIAYGSDVYNRPFVTMCIDIVYPTYTIPTCTTFFKRFTNECSIVYNAWSSYRKLLSTFGGMNIPQFTLVRDLLKNGEVVFTDESDEYIERMRLLCYDRTENEIHEVYTYKRPVRLVVCLHDETDYV